MKVSYQPLFNVLISKKIEPNQLVRDGVVTNSTLLEILKGNCLSMEELTKIGKYLGCNLNDIVKIMEDKKE
ncbi:MAG: helix-turn-helix domain-containing protein [Clostridiaceae bacterium]